MAKSLSAQTTTEIAKTGVTAVWLVVITLQGGGTVKRLCSQPSYTTYTSRGPDVGDVDYVGGLSNIAGLTWTVNPWPGVNQPKQATITIANAADPPFSDVVDGDDIEGAEVTIDVIFDSSTVIDTDATRIATLRVRSWSASYGGDMVLDCIDPIEYQYRQTVPTQVIDATTFPQAPEENIGRPLPWLFGTFDDTDYFDYVNAPFVPGIMIDEIAQTYVIADHRSDDAHTTNPVLVYEPRIPGFTKVINNATSLNDSGRTTINLSASSVVDTEREATFLVYGPGSGSDFTSSSDIDQLKDLNISSGGLAVTFGGTDDLHVRFRVPRLGVLLDATGDVVLYVSHSGDAAGNKVDVEWFDISGGSSATTAFFLTGVGTPVEQSTNIDSAATNGRDWTNWDFSEHQLQFENILSGAVTVYEIRLIIRYRTDIEEMSSDILPSVRAIENAIQSPLSHAQAHAVRWRFITSHTRIPSHVFGNFNGYEDLVANYADGSAIRSANNELARPPDILEAILRDNTIGFGLNEADINLSSFDDAATELGASFVMAFSLAQEQTFLDFADNLCRQSKMRFGTDANGKPAVYVLDSSEATTFDFTTANVQETGGILLEKTPADEVFTEYRINYKINYGSGEYLGVETADPAGDTHSSETLSTACSNAKTNFDIGQARIFTMDCDLIRDATTAESLLSYYVNLFTDTYYLVTFTALGWKALEVEPADLVTFTDDFLPPTDLTSATKYEVMAVSYTFPVGMQFVIREA